MQTLNRFYYKIAVGRSQLVIYIEEETVPLIWPVKDERARSTIFELYPSKDKVLRRKVVDDLYGNHIVYIQKDIYALST